jgi:hypothetical protein
LVISSRTSHRIEPEQFAAIIGPCLTLVAPSGMSRDDRRGWAHAAHQAIGDVPADMLKRAAKEAMRTADHPSKIVPAINRVIAAEREAERLRDITTIRPVAFIPDKRAPVPHEETQAILRDAGLNTASADPDTPKPVNGGTGERGMVPTRADYLRMGVPAELLDAMAS